MDMKEIISAWITKFNPKESQKNLAKERYEVCEQCSKRETLFNNHKWSEYCGECSCLLEGKIFSRLYDACPLHKWKPVEDKYLSESSKIKQDKTLI